MLDKQYHLYSVDTGHFYSNHEKYLHNINCKYQNERNEVLARLSEIETKLKQSGYSKDDIKNLKKQNLETTDISVLSHDMAREYLQWQKISRHKHKKAMKAKAKLLTLLSHKVNQNEMTNGRDHIRTIRQNSLNDTNIISSFDSALSRAIGIGQDDLTEDLIVVQIYYFDIFKDICFYGFIYNGEKYKYYTSSASQIRKKKAVFIKESVWHDIEQTLMCGLTTKKINEKGGNNVNKHLAYMALANSATDEWTDFDIDKSIVIHDFETNVSGTFDFVDETDYSITRKTDEIPIPHTDGAGMILPSVSDKNFMFRAPWMKGLLGVFDFRKFIIQHQCSPVITDIYGKKHNILKEDIRIIFTKSQFKMHRYYDSWDEYKTYFKKYHCSAGKCNIEEDRIKNAKINYQMLQTLTDITDDEIDTIIHDSAERIKNICNSKETMMDILEITPYNTHMNPFQKAVKLYPALLNDTFAKDTLREIKDSLLKKYRSGKLEINGKYTFILPDYYAACEYWFEHTQNPEGLLDNNEVFCQLFKQYDKLDCLRSPHLYKEHAIRNNTAHISYGKRADKIREWFPTNGLYASTHDLISKLLMYDVDGDKSLVIADKNFITIAERNMKGIVPLYYNMRKSEPTELNNKTIFAGLSAAFTGGNIGIYSNNISKIWNDDVFLSGSEKEKQNAIDCVKRLCCQNNFVIDFAKTLYQPEFPHEIQKQISKYTSSKLPAFFEFAKDKDKSQVEKQNGSFVNKLYDKIPNKPINTRGMKLGTIKYQTMMSNKKIICSKEVSSLYNRLNKQYRYMRNMKEEHNDNMPYIVCKIREEFNSLGYSDETIADMLTEYLYGREKRYKQLFWLCYGQYIINNLERNLTVPKTKFVQCIDCGEWMEVSAKNNETNRCMKCYSIYRKKYKAKKEKIRRQQKKQLQY